MTRQQLIDRVKRDRPGESTDAELNLWLDQLDMRWTDEVLETHLQEMHPEQVLDLEDLSDTAWWGNDSSVMGYGLTVKRHGPVISIQGKATASCEIWINGPALEMADEASPLWSYQAPMVGPEEGAWVLNYGYAMPDDSAVSMTMARSIDGQNAIQTGLMMLQESTSSWASNINWGIMSMSIHVGAGQEFGEGWAVVLLLNTENKHLPANWLRGIQPDILLGKTLLIPEIDREVYIHWLYAKIDYRLGEMERYNNDAVMFNMAWTAAAKRWHRQHLPKGRQVIHNVYGHPFPWHPVEDPLNQRGDWAKY